MRLAVHRLARLPGGTLRWGTAPREPSRSAPRHVVRHHIDDSRQSATPGRTADEVRDALQSECCHVTPLRGFFLFRLCLGGRGDVFRARVRVLPKCNEIT